MGNLAGWPYWKVVSITGQAGAGTDYQVELEIGDSAGGQFNLEGHCTNFPQDICITDDDGTTLLDHWVEDITADPIIVWVEVKDDLGSNQDIRVYYGKSGETTVSNVDNTMLFGDEFNAALDSNKWTTVQGSITTNGGNLELLGTTGTRGLIQQNTANYPAIPQSSILTVHGYGTSRLGATHWCTMRKAGDWTYRADITGQDTTDDIRLITSNGGAESSTILYDKDITSIHDWIIKWYSGHAAYYRDSTLLIDHTSNIPTVDLVVAFYESAASGDIFYADYMYVRKYNSPEPAFSSAGAEQSPTGVSPTAVFYGPLVGPFGGPI